jgi:hypothetical protein
MKIAHAVEYGVLLGEVVGKFGQSLGRPTSDTHGQTCPLFDPLTHLPAHGWDATVQVRDRFDAQEAFVNAVHLDVRGEVPQDGDHPVAHVTIQNVVGGEGQNAVLACQIFHLEPGRAHRHAQRLDLIASGDSTAVVIGEHHERHAFQLGLEYALAGDVEVVHVHQGELWWGRHGYPREV